jgi:hypothetical protein
MKINTDQRRLTPAAFRAAHDGNMKNFMAAITPGGIEAQEKSGQLEQAEKQTLPLELGSKYGGSLAEHRKPWEALGFKFGNTVDGIFVETIFPAGWKKVTTDHSMWSDIVDEKGRKRGSIFYKAAFYDRSAHAHLACRFGVTQTYGSEQDRTARVFVSDACGIVKQERGPFPAPDWKQRDEAIKRDNAIQAARNELIAWLKKEYPDCDSPTAYWDAP